VFRLLGALLRRSSSGLVFRNSAARSDDPMVTSRMLTCAARPSIQRKSRMAKISMQGGSQHQKTDNECCGGGKHRPGSRCKPHRERTKTATAQLSPAGPTAGNRNALTSSTPRPLSRPRVVRSAAGESRAADRVRSLSAHRDDPQSHQNANHSPRESTSRRLVVGKPGIRIPTDADAAVPRTVALHIPPCCAAC